MVDKSVPLLFEIKEKCMGCGACKAICPQEAIQMVPDEEGFLYPAIVEQACIRCGLCLVVCPLKSSYYSSSD